MFGSIATARMATTKIVSTPVSPMLDWMIAWKTTMVEKPFNCKNISNVKVRWRLSNSVSDFRFGFFRRHTAHHLDASVCSSSPFLVTAAFGGGNNNGGNGNNNNNYNYNNNQNSFYIGPYCSEGQSIYLGAFYDEDCSNQADADTFQAQNYGDGFPYFNEPILYGNECLSCSPFGEENDDDNQYNNNNYNNYNNYNNNQEYEVNELCQRSTEEAIKCDANRGYSSGCTFLDYTLPCLDGRGCVDPDDDSNGGGIFSGQQDFSSELYPEMAEKLGKYKRAAFALGALTGAVLLASLGMCMWCYCRPSLLQSSKKNPLLRRRRPVGPLLSNTGGGNGSQNSAQ